MRWQGARLNADARRKPPLCIVGGSGETFEQHCADQSTAQWTRCALPVDRWPGVQELARLQVRASLAGRTSTSSAVDQSIAANACSFAWRRRGSARAAASASSVPFVGGRQSTTVTGTACDRSASANTSTPAVTTPLSAVGSPSCGAAQEADGGARGIGVGQVTSAPASRRASAWRSRPCGSSRVPISAMTTGRSRAASSRARRISAASSAAGSGGRRDPGRRPGAVRRSSGPRRHRAAGVRVAHCR